MSTQTVNEPSQQPINIIEPTTAKAKIPPKPSQNTKSYTRKTITAPQGGSQEPRRNSLGSRPSKGSSDPLSQLRRERSFETMDCEDVPKPHQPKARVHLIPSKWHFYWFCVRRPFLRMILVGVSSWKHKLTGFVRLPTKQSQNQIPTPGSHRGHGSLMSVRKLY